MVCRGQNAAGFRLNAKQILSLSFLIYNVVKIGEFLDPIRQRMGLTNMLAFALRQIHSAEDVSRLRDAKSMK